MKTTRELKILSRILLFAGVFFIVVFFSDWFSGPFYFNRNFRALKYILCVIYPALTALFNIIQEKSLGFLKNSSVIILSSFVVGLFVFNLMGINQFMLSEMATLYHISYALICVFSLFFTVALAAYFNLVSKEAFEEYNNVFFLGYIPMLVTLFVLLYGNFRFDTSGYSLNLIPFRGEIGDIIKNHENLTLMRTIGNVAFYSTISLTAARFFKKHTALFAFAVPFLISIFAEAVQGIFSIGNADIDDVILNGLGALIGALIYKFLIEKIIRRKEICSE